MFSDDYLIPSWAMPYLQDALDAGLINGYPDGTFQPDVNVTRLTLGVTMGKVARQVQAINNIEIQKLMKLVANGVVQITTDQGLGAGLVVSTAGHVLTAKHVIDGATSINIGWSSPYADSATYPPVSVGMPTTVLAVDATHDLAILNPAWSRTFEPLALSSKWDTDSEINVDDFGKTLFAQGSPLGLSGWFSQLNAEGLRVINGLTYLGLSGPINPGNSGGPVFDITGSVVGVVDLKLTGTAVEGAGMCIPLTVILPFLQANGVTPVMS